MPQILLQLDTKMAKQLERVAPAKSRSRSRFIRLAIQRALMDLEELNTRAAYEKAPDLSPAWLDIGTWDEWKPKGKQRKPR